MDKEEYLQQHRTESVRFNDKPDIKPPGVQQQQQQHTNRTGGKNHRFNAECFWEKRAI